MKPLPPEIQTWEDLDHWWTCHVCKEWRPDEAIAVQHHQHWSPGFEMACNVRYCRDKPECVASAALMCWLPRVPAIESRAAAH